MDVAARILSRFSLFSGLDDQARREIALDVHERTYDPGQVIILAGERCEAVYLVVRGTARSHRLSLEGREYVLYYLGSGQVFNLVPAFDGGPNVATVEALTAAVIYSIPCDRFRQFALRHQEITSAALELLADRVRYLSDRIEDLALHTVRTRLARFLLSRADVASSPRHWTQEEIAAHIGTVRDVVGRTLRAFAREGLIRRERGRLVVTDMDGLRHEAMQE